MAIEISQNISNLNDLLEKYTEWSGTGNLNNGSSGTPSNEFVNAFDEAMSIDTQAQISDDKIDISKTQKTESETIYTDEEIVQESQEKPLNSVTETVQKEGVDFNQNKNEDLITELKELIAKQASPGEVLSPQMLFRMQYLVGVLHVDITSGSQGSQQMAQNMESLLRQK